MTHVLSLLSAVMAPNRVLSGETNDDYSHDEPLSGQRMRRVEIDGVNMAAPVRPARPGCQVAGVRRR